MTVGRLIDILQDVDPELPVVVDGADGEMFRDDPCPQEVTLEDETTKAFYIGGFWH